MCQFALILHQSFCDVVTVTYVCTGVSKLGDQVFIKQNQAAPNVMVFHPFDPHLAVADKENIR